MQVCNKVRKRLQMPRFPHLFSMLEIFSLVGKEQLSSSLTSVEQLVIEPLNPTSEFIFKAQLSLFWGTSPQRSLSSTPLPIPSPPQNPKKPKHKQTKLNPPQKPKIYFENQKPLTRLILFPCLPLPSPCHSNVSQLCYY